MKDFVVTRCRQDGLSYEEYRAHWHEQKEVSPKGKAPDEKKRLHYLNYNWERQAQVHETYTPSAALRNAVSGIDEPQSWLVLTEPWCGDSAFLLPVIAEVASLNDDITLRILLRDDHLDVMDEYLTDGSRSIPKLVVFSAEGEELFTWGPRPEEARRLFADLREQYDDKMDAITDLIEHYEEGGWQAAETELVEELQSAVLSPSLE